MRSKEELKQIKVYAEHYHYPISDISGFNCLLKENGFKSVKRETSRKLLNY